jgi:REP element-mobilizing transposase RayT
VTLPRQILPGTTYLVTRRCSERRFFLRPSRLTSQTFLYVLAVVARRHDIRVHAYCVLSNHYHLLVTDPHARLPLFQRDLDGLIARAVNCSLGRWESFWAPESYSAVRLESLDDVLQKAVYVLANPVAAGLVRRGLEWPGLWSSPSAIGTAIPVERPTHFFRKAGPLPLKTSLELHPPAGFATAGAFAERLSRELIHAEDRVATELSREGRSFLGVHGVLAQNPRARPAPGEPRRALNPRVACRDKWKRIEALLRLADFVRVHREALEAWRAGLRQAIFPPGTWLMRVQHAVRCAGSG